jgi:hypothetical protein
VQNKIVLDRKQRIRLSPHQQNLSQKQRIQDKQTKKIFSHIISQKIPAFLKNL